MFVGWPSHQARDAPGGASCDDVFLVMADSSLSSQLYWGIGQTAGYRWITPHYGMPDVRE